MAGTDRYVRSTSANESPYDEVIESLNQVVDDLAQFVAEWNAKVGGATTILCSQGQGFRVIAAAIPTIPGVASTVQVTSGDSQSATVATPVTNPMVVTVRDVLGQAVVNAPVFWTGPQNSIVTPMTTTNGSGQASVTPILGETAGSQVFTATLANGASTNFTLTGTAGAAASIERGLTQPENQTAPVSTAVAQRPGVFVLDAYGNRVQGTTVTYAVTAGGGSGTSLTPSSNSSGEAIVGSWTLGATPGLNTMTATAAGLVNSPMTFSASGTGGVVVATRLQFSSGGSQSGVTAGAAAASIVVLVDNGSGTPVQGMVVSASVTAGGGSLDFSTRTTDASGLATFVLTTGTTVGTNTVSLSGVDSAGADLTGSPLTATVTTVAGAANKWGIAQQPSSNADSGVVFAVQPRIQLQDVNGNSVSTAGVTVTAAKASGAGTLAGDTTQDTNASGLAIFTDLAFTGAGSTNTIQFTGGGYTAVTSANVVIASPFPVATQFAGGLSPVVTGGTIPTFTVYIVDANNVIVPTATNTVALTVSAGGTLGGTTSVAAVAGVATFSAVTLTGANGTYTITATVSGLPTADTESIVVTSPSTLFPNEPAGMTPVFGVSGVVLESGAANLTFADVQFRNAVTYTSPAFTAGSPINAPGVPPTGDVRLAEIGFSAGHLAGTGSGTFYRNPPITTMRGLYVHFWCKVSSNWYGEASGQIKIYQPLTNTNGVSNRIIVSLYNGAGTGQLSARVAFQGTVFPGNTGNLSSNTGQAGGAALVDRDEWNLCEVYVVGNSAGTRDGIFRMWVNGIMTHNYVDRQYDAGAVTFKNPQIQSVYGGSSGAVPNIQYIWVASPYYASYHL